VATISQIAQAADVSVESVLRVLNRDDVSSDVAARVVAAMDKYGYDRLPRADAAPKPRAEPNLPEEEAAGEPENGSHAARVVIGEVVDFGARSEDDDAITRAREQLLQAVVQVASELGDPSSARQHSEALAVRPLAARMTVMDALFERLAEDLDGIKRELGRARSERLEDLTLLVDLITTSWRSVDQRLGRIERKLERIEGTPDLLPSRRAISMAEHRERPQP
jgi:Bacterial regulatory proteins, lacI family